tara:strand:+ start:441 stop:1070 length:630 start_codon:yes stop_codon:yes gene_type:complete
MYNLITEVPTAIIGFYSEEVVTEPTGNMVTELYMVDEYDESTGEPSGSQVEQSREVPEMHDVTYVREAVRPETKTQADLDRVISLGKPAKVREAFQAMVELGNLWDWYGDYTLWLGEVDTYEQFVPEDILDEDGEVVGQTSMEPVGDAPVQKASVTLDYKALRVAAYPKLSEFADAYVHLQGGDSVPMTAYVEKCAGVKAEFPKAVKDN